MLVLQAGVAGGAGREDVPATLRYARTATGKLCQLAATSPQAAVPTRVSGLSPAGTAGAGRPLARGSAPAVHPLARPQLAPQSPPGADRACTGVAPAGLRLVASCGPGKRAAIRRAELTRAGFRGRPGRASERRRRRRWRSAGPSVRRSVGRSVGERCSRQQLWATQVPDRTSASSPLAALT